jgi:hypothetical protein
MPGLMRKSCKSEFSNEVKDEQKKHFGFDNDCPAPGSLRPPGQ